jgi:hypothetical protein
LAIRNAQLLGTRVHRKWQQECTTVA